ncbi:MULTISPECIES: Kelch repeat-containing protein [Bacillus]|uniref:Kelch repeat-containing protein n=1 Tax=Bacillus TaxID=1386 RepID=UPI000C6D7D8E|nr:MULTISPECIES: kelch repeat-containing protein [Bacillus amyloliquefaciens group]MBG9464042.1 hypothetical protein [Bacillus amyloliquefaciens]MCQ9152221.1 hypothetical protein [Bacillus amyloliquefaciens]QVL37944.1 hypothetical protein KH263_10270 [Bacillus velezensis]
MKPKLKVIFFILLFACFVTSANYSTVVAEETNQSDSEKQWIPQAPLTDPRTAAATAVVNGNIYVMGGTNIERVYFDTYIYNPENNTWKYKANMPQPRTGTAAAVVGDKIYIMGGQRPDTLLKTQEVRSMYVYDTKSNKWSTLPDIPTNATLSSAVSVGDNIYLLGAGNYQFGWKKVYCYNTIKNTWEEKGDLPEGAKGSAAQVVGDKIYILGGSGNDDLNNPQISNRIYEYDIKDDKWRKVQELKTPVLYPASTTLKGKIYILGGKTSANTKTSKVQVYDPVTNSVQEIKSFNNPRLAAGAATIGNDIYIIGGQASTGGVTYAYNSVLTSVEKFTVPDNGDSTEQPTTDKPIPDQQDKSTNRAILTITLSTGLEKEFDLSMQEINEFINWYDQKDSGTGPSRFEIDKHDNNIGPFEKRKDHVIFKNILTFEVNEYTSKNQ